MDLNIAYIFILLRASAEKFRFHSCHRDILAQNLKTVSDFGIVAFPTQLVGIPFLTLPFFCKSTCPQHGFTDPEALAPFHLLLGSTSWFLPALAYASDRHVTDVIIVISHQSRVMSAVCLSYESVTFTGILSGLSKRLILIQMICDCSQENIL